MKQIKRFIGASVPFALFVAADTTHAQNSVTLYGIVNTGLMYINNVGGHSMYKTASGTVSGNRWGLLGSEELGGGLNAVFNLEGGFSSSTGQLGQNGRVFGRQAHVGLSDKRFGTVTLGRQYMSDVDYVSPLSPGSIARHPYDNDDFGGNNWINNAIKFQSVNYGGFKFGGLYAFSNSAAFADSRAYSFGASYSSGGLTVASSYVHLNNSGSTTNAEGALARGDATFNAGLQRTWATGVNYAFGSSVAGLVISRTQLSDATSIRAGLAGTSSNLILTDPSARFVNYEINGTHRLTPQFAISAVYTFTDARLNGVSPKYQQITVLADYSFSKRTDVYAEAAFQHVSETGDSNFTAGVYSVSRSSNRSQSVATVGIRHRF